MSNGITAERILDLLADGPKTGRRLLKAHVDPKIARLCLRDLLMADRVRMAGGCRGPWAWESTK